MTIKRYKPTSNGRRNMTGSDFAEIATSTPEKSLLQPLKNHTGRNNNGHITVRHQGDGHKRRYRVIDFKHNKDNVVATVRTTKYDPNRSANIALVHYEDEVKAYVLTPKGPEVGMKLVSGPEADVRVGNAPPLENIPISTVIHNIKIKPSRGGQLIHSAGTSAQVFGREGKYVLIRLNSGEVHMILAACHATVGSIGNEQHGLINIDKTGYSHWMREHPTMRGSVMNPSGHPYGSDEDEVPIERKAPVSPWSQSALGYKTHNKGTRSDKLIVRRRKNK